jgi:hypothetical protein
MALRYYGPIHGEQYFNDVYRSDGGKNTYWVCITPERWLTVDYSKLGEG